MKPYMKLIMLIVLNFMIELSIYTRYYCQQYNSNTSPVLFASISGLCAPNKYLLVFLVLVKKILQLILVYTCSVKFWLGLYLFTQYVSFKSDDY